MKALLLKLPWFRNWLADAWDEGFDAGEGWNQSTPSGIPIDPPRNPFG